VRTLTLPRGHAYAVAYAPDGRTLVSGNARGCVHFWDLADFSNRFVFQVPDVLPKVWAVAFSPGGERLMVERHLFDARPLAAALDLPGGTGEGPEALALPEVRLQEDAHKTGLLDEAATELLGTPDGQAVVGRAGFVLEHGALKQWDLDGRCRRTVPVRRFTHPLAFAPDGRALAASRDTTTLTLLDWPEGREVADLRHTDRVERAAFTPDGRLLASAAGRTVRLWDVSSRECLTRFPAFPGPVFGLAVHPRGRLLAAGGTDGTVRLWDVAALREVERYDWQVGAIHGVAFAPDGMTAAAAGDRKAIVVWDVGEA
jgi:WD40 repeat protein